VFSNYVTTSRDHAIRSTCITTPPPPPQEQEQSTQSPTLQPGVPKHYTIPLDNQPASHQHQLTKYANNLSLPSASVSTSPTNPQPSTLNPQPSTLNPQPNEITAYSPPNEMHAYTVIASRSLFLSIDNDDRWQDRAIH
jgi:hypothetical protein